MIRFVDLRSADIEGHRFTFWNTVTDTFVCYSGTQAWDTWDEFIDDFDDINIMRYWNLCPSWIFSNRFTIDLDPSCEVDDDGSVILTEDELTELINEVDNV